MRASSLIWLAAQAASRLKVVSPRRRYERLASFGYASVSALPVAEIDLDGGCTCQRCAGIAYASAHELRRYARPARGFGLRQFGRPTLALFDLRTLDDVAAYERAVSRASGGNDNRLVKKARRLGFTVRQIKSSAYVRSYAEIRESKPVRSQGPVLYAKLKRASGLRDMREPAEPPTCERTWLLDFGVFAPEADGERLVAFAQLRRAGNYVELSHLMGHGDYLKQGVVKLLLFELIGWLLGPHNALAGGLAYLHYGAIESGSPATTQWRRYMQFSPYVPQVRAARASVIPADFSGLRYLSLNPDVAAAGMDPRLHYALFGVHKGYAYAKRRG